MPTTKTNQNSPERKSGEQVEDIFSFDNGSNPRAPEQRPEARPAPERKRAPETAPEQRPERREQPRPEDESARRGYMPPAPAAEPEQTAEQVKSERLQKIEQIMSENLDELYLGMTPQQQMEFKQKGEETATRIEQLLGQAKIKAKEILTLIKDWLKIIPGVNTFFLEQEAKIKTDRIINIHEQNRQNR